jgi:hypothetical protein
MGLDQLALLPDDRKRRRQELELRTALNAVWQAIKGFAAPEMGPAYARARELWKQLGSPSEFLHLSYGQSRYHAYRGEYALAQRLDEDLLRLSRQRDDSAGLVLGYWSTGRDLLFAGRFVLSRSHLEAGLTLYDPILHHSLVQQTTFHPQVALQAILSFVMFCLGYPEQALAQSNAAIAVFGCDLGVAYHSAFARRRYNHGEMDKPANYGRDRTWSPPLSRTGSDPPRLGQGQEW